MPPHIVVPPAPRRQLFFARQRNTPGAVESPVHDGPSMAKEIEGILDEDGELRVFEPVELFIESLSRLAARLVFALWYLVLVVAVVLEALPQAQWNAMNFCGPDYSATLQDFKKWDSPCVTVNAGSSGTSVMWTGTDLHSMDNHFRSYQQIAMSLPRPMAVNGEHPKRELDITVTYRGDVEAVTMSLTLTCPSSSSRCNMIRLPIDLAANHALGVDGGATLQLVNPPSSLVEAFLQGSTSAVGIVYQRSGYTIATLIWRYAFLVFTLAHALRFASRLRFTGRLYEQVWVLFLQWTAIWYLNPLHALFLTSIPRSSAIAFVEFHFPTIFLCVTIGFMLSVITSSMSWEGSKKLPPSVTELPDVATPSSMSRTAVGQQQQEQSSSGIAAAGSCVECAAATSLVRLLRHQDNLYEPPFWTKCLVLVYVLGVIALIIAQACSDPYFWSITATSLSETGHAVALSWTVLAVLFAGALMSTILLFYLRRHLGRKLYLESRPQQLACRVFLMVFIATMVFYTIHVLLFLLYYNRGKYQAAATTQLFLQLPSIMVASMFVNIMTMVYMNRTPTSGQVPVPPSDPRWKLMIWPDSWYRWLAMHGGSQYIFATETEENNFYRKQLQFRRRQRLHQQKKEWFRRQSRKSRRDISVVASTGTARPDLEESSIMNMDHHSTFFLPVGSSNPPSRMPSCPPSTVNNGSRRLEMYPSLDGSFSRAALPHLHEALSPLNRRRTDNGSLTLDASALRQPTNDSSELSRFSTFPLREGGSMGSPRGEDLSLTNTQMHMHRFPNFRVTHQRTREPSTLHDSGVISLAASNVSSDSESDSHSLNSSSGNVGEQDSASRMEMGSGDIFYQIFLRVERHLGGAISRVNRSLIHPTARRLSRYENVLFDATFGRFQTSAQYLPFFTLDTAMDCLNLSWEVYSLMPTSWREEEAAQQPGQLHPGKVASSGWGCCLPVSDVDSSHGGGVGDDGSSSCSCDEAEPPRVNGPALSGGVFSTPDAASSYRRPIPRPPALTATRRPLPEEAASVSVDVSEDEEEEPSRMPSGSDVGMSANSLPSSPRTIEVPIDVEKYGYELLFVTEIKGVQVLLARMSAAAAEHVGKAPRLVVAFRGTANMENARYDLRMRRGVWDEMERELRRRGPRERQSQQHTCQRHRRASEHDDTETEEVSAATAGCCSSWKTPALERPSVHAGFLSLWRAMRSRVLRELRKVLEANPNTVYRIFCTGHSLGGALASLCAYSTTLELERRRYPLPEVTAYTYGQPRLGNAAFCSAFDQKVPRLFRVVNESDMVATTGMCGSHHVGIEVDVDRHGNYIVQPTAIEQTLRPTTGQGLTVINHLLTNYGASLECMARRLDCPARFMHPYEL